MRLLYAPLVSDRELRIEAGRVCWWRNGSKKEGTDEDGGGMGFRRCRHGNGNRDGMLGPVDVQVLTMIESIFPRASILEMMPRSELGARVWACKRRRKAQQDSFHNRGRDNCTRVAQEDQIASH